MSFRTLILAATLSGCAANTVGTGGGELEERPDGGRDAGRRDAGRQDASVRSDAGTVTRSDASTPSGGSKACPSGDPHGCYVLTDDSPEGCPEKSPEIPLGLPAFTDWELCNGGAVSAGQTCVWEGPEGGTASCLCDTGVHWLCIYL